MYGCLCVYVSLGVCLSLYGVSLSSSGLECLCSTLAGCVSLCMCDFVSRFVSVCLLLHDDTCTLSIAVFVSLHICLTSLPVRPALRSFMFCHGSLPIRLAVSFRLSVSLSPLSLRSLMSLPIPYPSLPCRGPSVTFSPSAPSVRALASVSSALGTSQSPTLFPNIIRAVYALWRDEVEVNRPGTHKMSLN